MRKSIIMTIAATMAALTTLAQPAPVKKAAKAVLTLTTYNKDGSVKSSGTHGAFIGNNGEAVGLWTPFMGAARATVTDASGNTLEVLTIMGANELYDVCKFKVAGKPSGATMATAPAANGGKLWLAAGDNKGTATQHAVEKVETFMEKYAYYLFSSDNAPSEQGCPLFNEGGQVVAIQQQSSDESGMHAVDTRYINSLTVDGLSVLSPIFQRTGLRLELPADKDQALIMLTMAHEQRDSLQQAQYIDDFIRMFPTAIDGYSQRAMNYLVAGRFDEADKDMLTALAKATDKAEAHAEYSRVIYQKVMFSPDTTYTKWTLDKALDEIRQANAISPKPAYKHREAQIIYSKGDYSQAYDMFMALTKEDMAHQELYYEAAQCKAQLGASDSEVLQLLDNSVEACPKPLQSISAPYVLARGQMLDKMGEYRKALADYNVYDTLMLGRASDTFYYTRFKCETQVKQYLQALNDIAHAALLNPTETMYVAEMSSLQLRLNQVDDALKTADICIRLAPEATDAYIIKGIALMHKDNKAEAMSCFEKAKELGDDRAQALIDKYK